MDKAVLTKKIIRNLARVNALKDGFKRDSENIRKNPLQSDIYKDSQVNALRDALSKALSALVAETEADAQALVTLLRDEVPSFDLADPALQNALLLTQALGRDTPSEVQQSIVKHFAKNAPALRALSPLFAKAQMFIAGQEAEAILREQACDLAFLQSLPDQVYYDSLTTEPTSNTARLLEYMRTFAYAHGVSVPEMESEEENLQAILDAKAQQAKEEYMFQIAARKTEEDDPAQAMGCMVEQTAQAVIAPEEAAE